MEQARARRDEIEKEVSGMMINSNANHYCSFIYHRTKNSGKSKDDKTEKKRN
jgi:hypothetical protein